MKIDIVKKIIEKYLEYFPDEKEELKKLNNLINQDKENAFDSKNPNGHVTASGYIYNKKDKTILLLEHKKAGFFLQPGGHSEEKDRTILDTAIREIYEETGLKDLEIRRINEDILVPMDINIHPISENKSKDMPSHYHHDFRYIFIVDEEQKVIIDKNESNSYKWVSIEKIQNDPRFKNVIKKINNILNI